MKKIAITMGDPAGVGPEIIVRALSDTIIRQECLPLVIGDYKTIQEAIELTGAAVGIKMVQGPEEVDSSADRLCLFDIPTGEIFIKRKPTAEGGRACIRYIEAAVRFARDKRVDGMVTAPITKEALKLAGAGWPGHTEMLAEMTGTTDYAMLLSGGPLRVILVTIHTAIRNVPEMIKTESVLKTIRLAAKACRMLDIDQPRIAVAGLNPHAGEAGMFGYEEQTAIMPAIEAAYAEGISCTGPYPPDTLFNKAYGGAFDIIVCMYHDQGLIPLKMIAFDRGVNTTIGLPIIRTSPDHGTAYDIAWKGVASPSSMIEAISLAVKIRV